MNIFEQTAEAFRVALETFLKGIEKEEGNAIPFEVTLKITKKEGKLGVITDGYWFDLDKLEEADEERESA